jgi:predicted CoA-binding protein
MSALIDEEQLIERTVRDARVVAVIGMKDADDALAPAYTVPAVMKQRGIRVIPVNPTIASALGEPSRAGMGDVRERVDVVQIFRRSELVGPHADEILSLPPELRPTVVWMQTGIADEKSAARLRAAGIGVIMDRCFAVEMSRHGRR